MIAAGDFPIVQVVPQRIAQFLEQDGIVRDGMMQKDDHRLARPAGGQIPLQPVELRVVDVFRKQQSVAGFVACDPPFVENYDVGISPIKTLISRPAEFFEYVFTVCSFTRYSVVALGHVVIAQRVVQGNRQGLHDSMVSLKDGEKFLGGAFDLHAGKDDIARVDDERRRRTHRVDLLHKPLQRPPAFVGGGRQVRVREMYKKTIAHVVPSAHDNSNCCKSRQLGNMHIYHDFRLPEVKIHRRINTVFCRNYK